MKILFDKGYCRIMPMSVTEDVYIQWYCPNISSLTRYAPPHEMKCNLRASYIVVSECPDCGMRHKFPIELAFSLVPAPIITETN